jgi:hypothetical protein
MMLSVEHSGPDGGALRTERYEVIEPRRSPEHREGLRAALLAAVALPGEGEAYFSPEIPSDLSPSKGTCSPICGRCSVATWRPTMLNPETFGAIGYRGCRGYRCQRRFGDIFGDGLSRQILIRTPSPSVTTVTTVTGKVRRRRLVTVVAVVTDFRGLPGFFPN